MKKLSLSLIGLTLLVAPLMVGAQAIEDPTTYDFSGFTRIDPPTAPGGITGLSGFAGLLISLLGWIQIFFWIAAVFFGLYAAFLYLTARGDSEKISRANQMLIYVVVAVIVAVIAFAIPSIVANTIGGN